MTLFRLNYKSIFPLFIFCVFVFFLSIAIGKSEENITSYEKLYNDLQTVKIDSANAGWIKNITFIREAAQFNFESGIIYPTFPLNEKVRIAVFVGKGIINYTPSTKIEKDHLFRFFETENYKSEFEYLFMIFADSTYEEFKPFMNHEDLNNYDKAEFVTKESLRFFSEEKQKYFDTYIMKSFLEEHQNNFFISSFEDEEGRILFYEVDTYSPEEVKLLSGHIEGFRRKTRLDNINSFEAKSDAINNELKYDDLIEIDKYIINVEIERDVDFSASAEIEMVSKLNNQKHLNFLMYYKFEVDSVFLNDEKITSFFKGEDNANLWIELNEPMKKDSLYSLKIYYQGDILEKNLKAWVYLKSSNGWFPRYGTRKYSNYDLTFKYPSSMELISVGEKVKEEFGEDYNTSRWVTNEKIRNASFNLGIFKKYEFNDEDIPKIKTFHSKYGHRGSVRGMEEEVGEDVLKSVRFFQDMYGKLDTDTLNVTEIPFLHGEAFKGLIHLSFTTFINTHYSGFDHSFRGHEVAHQWWGIGVDFETYHDQWLSEAFAEYSGLMYLQHVTEGNDKFFDLLEEYKNAIFTNRKQEFWEGQEAGPIYLGIRTSGKETRGDYNLIIYKKGAWVLHMLRMLLRDTDSENDNCFKGMMSDFYASYKGGKATTEDFKKIVDKHFEEDMSWFFNQWVYDTFLPTYQFAYNAALTPEGEYKISCKVALEESYPSHKMFVPILIKSRDGESVKHIIKLEGDKTQFDLPPVSFEPDEVIFNDQNYVLCEVEDEDWEDINF